jgi:hypothetical protein
MIKWYLDFSLLRGMESQTSLCGKIFFSYNYVQEVVREVLSAGLCPSFGVLNSTINRKLNVFALLILVSEAMCSLEYLTMDKVQALSIAECFTPSSEPFIIQLFKVLCRPRHN